MTTGLLFGILVLLGLDFLGQWALAQRMNTIEAWLQDIEDRQNGIGEEFEGNPWD